jgi:hypothetical protein
VGGVVAALGACGASFENLVAHGVGECFAGVGSVDLIAVQVEQGVELG